MGLDKERYCRIDIISELKCMKTMPSRPNKMQRYGQFDVIGEAVMNEFNSIEQNYMRFQAPFGLN